MPSPVARCLGPALSWQVVAGSAIFVAALVLVVSRPGGLPEWVTALGGAAAMLLPGIVSPAQAVDALLGRLDVFGFFLGLMTISAVAETAGFFEALARLAARYSGQSASRLMLNVMLIGVLITVFLTNDATALILTPLVYSLVVRLRLEPLPYLFACTFIADTASFVLPVSNPINVLVLNAFPHPLSQYLAHMLLPAVLVITANILIFLWIFRTSLARQVDLTLLDDQPEHTRYFWFVVCSLGAIAVAYVTTSALGAPLSWVAPCRGRHHTPNELERIEQGDLQADTRVHRGDARAGAGGREPRPDQGVRPVAAWLVRRRSVGRRPGLRLRLRCRRERGQQRVRLARAHLRDPFHCGA